VLPTAWAEAGAAPFDNVIGEDPGLADPAGGDFRALNAPGYGCRVWPAALAGEASASVAGAVAAPAGAEPRPASASAPPLLARPGTRQDAGGVVDTDTVWDAALVRVLDDVVVTGGATLTVAAGARVEFAGFFGLTVADGSLQAVGTPDARIVWTTDDPDAWTWDWERRGAWRGIALDRVPAARDSTRLRWCVLEHAKAVPDEQAASAAPDLPAAPTAPAAVRGEAGPVLLGGMGGAVRVAGAGPLVIAHCVLRHNLAERGGAVAATYGAAPLLVGNLLHGNVARLRGAGLWASYSDPVLVHNTVTANVTEAPSSFIHTGAIDHTHAHPRHTGGVYWGNPTSYYDPVQIREGKAALTRYCLVADWVGGEGCLTGDAELEPAGAHPGAPRPGSPVIDAGSAAAAAPWLPAHDLAGRARVAGDEVDMGAYEWLATTAVSDGDAPGAGPGVPPAASLAVSLRAAPNPFNPRTRVDSSAPTLLAMSR